MCIGEGLSVDESEIWSTDNRQERGVQKRLGWPRDELGMPADAEGGLVEW